MIRSDPNDPDSVAHSSFNTQEDLFATATVNGFSVYETDPLKKRISRSIPGGVLVISLLDRTNILAFVSTCAAEKIQIWSDLERSVIAEIDLEGWGVPITLKLKPGALICVFREHVRIYSLQQLPVLLYSLQTSDNPKGLLDCSVESGPFLAVPAQRQGSIQLVKGDIFTESHARLQTTKTINIPAHEGVLSYIAMSVDGRLVATTSEAGTLVRIWDCQTGERITELRRGLSHVKIQCLAFLKTFETSQGFENVKLALISDSATLHIFNIALRVQSAITAKDKKTPDLPYTGSIAKLHIDYKSPHAKSGESNHTFQVVWINERCLIVLQTTGQLWKCSLEHDNASKSFTCHQEAYRTWSTTN